VESDVVEQAAYNNAVWCDAVCSTHAGPGEFARDYWLCRHPVPKFYPDMVTLAGAASATCQTDALAALVRDTPDRSLSIKDSFGCLSLEALGFVPLFDAEWFLASALGGPGSQQADEVRWVSIDNDADLTRWEQAWRLDAGRGEPRLFRPGLLARPDIRFVYGLAGDAQVAGGILSATGDVTGLSNVFASGISTEAALQGLARMAWTWRPGRPLVGYDRGADLAAARRVGFATIGRLRVWHRAVAGAR
jgi:hypothetical protein